MVSYQLTHAAKNEFFVVELSLARSASCPHLLQECIKGSCQGCDKDRDVRFFGRVVTVKLALKFRISAFRATVRELRVILSEFF